MCAFNIASTDPDIDPALPHYCERYAWSGTFAGNVLGNLLFQGVFQVLPAALGVNPKFYLVLSRLGPAARYDTYRFVTHSPPLDVPYLPGQPLRSWTSVRASLDIYSQYTPQSAFLV